MSAAGDYKLVCPACGGPIKIRNSQGQSPIFRSIYGECQILICGLKLAGSMTWDYELSPSGMDMPRVTLPVAPSVERMKALRSQRKQTDQMDLLEPLETEA